MYALNLAEDGRFLSATYEQYAAPDQPLVETLPDGNLVDYLFKDGAFIHEPLPKEEPVEEPDLQARIAELEEALELLLSGVTA